MSGKLQRGSDGKIRRGSDGKIKTHDPASPSPCCCTVACSDCSTTTPGTMTVSVTGISLCLACQQLETSGIYVSFTGDPNGTWTVTQTADPCVWSYTYDSSEFQVQEYGENTCTTTPTTSVMTLLVYSNRRVVIQGGGPSLVTVFVTTDTATPLNCSTAYTKSNALVGTDCGHVTLVGPQFYSAFGSSGSAHVTPN